MIIHLIIVLIPVVSQTLLDTGYTASDEAVVPALVESVCVWGAVVTGLQIAMSTLKNRAKKKKNGTSGS